ncbi:hypothetical protein [Mycolicibacterium palauense]|uniref:hypothetical protein n=1 Tax=Mycolicibacterium palauense TaxID=2034511 RepID=UPI001FE57525|nr:hypothetical protein [Mycolicibacterium palauense]
MSETPESTVSATPESTVSETPESTVSETARLPSSSGEPDFSAPSPSLPAPAVPLVSSLSAPSSPVPPPRALSWSARSARRSAAVFLPAGDLDGADREMPAEVPASADDDLVAGPDLLVEELLDDDEDEEEEVPSVSAFAAGMASIEPTPRKTARAPTRPMNRA